MQERTIDIPAVYRYSFQQFKKYASFLIGIMATYYVLAVVPQIFFFFRAPEEPTFESQITSLIITFLQLYLALGFTKIILLLLDDKHAEVKDMVNNGNLFLSYFVGWFLYTFAVIIGLFLFIIPGIFIAIRFQFYPYFIIEQNDNAIKSLQKSFFLSQNLTLDLLLFGITVIIANITGILFLGVGIIVTYPITTLATAIIYKGLQEQTRHIPGEKYHP